MRLRSGALSFRGYVNKDAFDRCTKETTQKREAIQQWDGGGPGPMVPLMIQDLPLTAVCILDYIAFFPETPL